MTDSEYEARYSLAGRYAVITQIFEETENLTLCLYHALRSPELPSETLFLSAIPETMLVSMEQLRDEFTALAQRIEALDPSPLPSGAIASKTAP